METSYYVIIYVNLGSSIQERVAIGMMMASVESGMMRFSDFKVEWLKKILHPNVITTIKLLQKNLMQTFMGFMGKDGFGIERFEVWVDGLHRNSNNLIGMCLPINILMPVNKDNFEELFHSEVDRFAHLSKQNTVTPKSDFSAKRVFTTLKTQVSEHLIFNYELTPDVFHKLLAPVTIPFAGQNEKIITGHWIDFTTDRSPLLIVPQINLLHETLTDDAGMDTFHIIISPEPTKNDTHFNLWMRMKEHEYIGLYTPDCLDQIIEYVIQNRIRPQLSLDRKAG